MGGEIFPKPEEAFSKPGGSFSKEKGKGNQAFTFRELGLFKGLRRSLAKNSLSRLSKN